MSMPHLYSMLLESTKVFCIWPYMSKQIISALNGMATKYFLENLKSNFCQKFA